MTAATAPMTMAAMGVIKPEAGVTAARPTTMPVAMPRVLGRPSSQPRSIQTTPAAAAEVLVVSRAFTATPLARQGAAGVEAEPAHPQEPGSQDGEGDVVGFHGELAEALAGTDHHGKGQGGITRGDVDHGAAGEVQDPQFIEPAALAPDPVGQRIIDQGDPDEAEEQEGLEAHPFYEGPGDQGRGDHREHHLEGGEEPVGNGLGVVGIGGRAHAGETQDN